MITSYLNAQKEINKYIVKNKTKKVFVLSGKNSYFKSGAKKFMHQILDKDNTLIYLKKSYFPELSHSDNYFPRSYINFISEKD